LIQSKNMKRETNLKFVRKEMEKLFAHNRKKSFNYKQIASALGAESTEAKNHIIRTLKTLEKEGFIEEVMPGKYLAIFVNEYLTGKLELTQRGAGFVIPVVEEGEAKTENADIFIAPENLNTAMH
jgi:exoribonuclease R